MHNQFTTAVPEAGPDTTPAATAQAANDPSPPQHSDPEPIAPPAANWCHLPQELRERPQWLLAGPNDDGDLKVPKSIDADGKLYPGSSTNRATWLTFDRAVEYAQRLNYGIGYVLSSEDPYTCIDLDVKNRNNRPDEPDRWTSQEDLDRYESMVNTFDSYTEKSQSGQGVHIWIHAKIGKGFKRNGVEVYSQERFIACTGNTSLDKPISDRQELVTNMVSQMSEIAERPGPIELVEVPEVDTDKAIFDRASGAANSEKFLALYSGDWIAIGRYRSQSEADMALMSMLCFYSPSNEQCRRMFRDSGLGHRPKAAKNNRYLDYTLRTIRSRMAAAAAELARVKIERWERIKKTGDGTLEPTPMPILTVDEMEAQLVFVRNRSFVAFLDRPTANATLTDMRNDFAASMTEVTVRAANGGTKKAMRPSIDLWIQRPNRLRADTLTFDPRYGQFCADPRGDHALNLYRPRAHSAPGDWAGRVQPFLDHVRYLVPVPEESERFLSWLAHIERHPGILPHSGYLMIAPKQGVGRNWMAAVLAMVWKGHVALDFDLNQTLTSGFNGRLSRKFLAVVDEANEGHQGTSTRNAEKFKSMITTTERHINPKYGFEHVEHNCCRWLVFSNYVSAIPIGGNDRRWNVIRNGDPIPQESYYSALYALLDEPKFIASVREWFRQRDITQFNPGALPPMNEAKHAVIESVRSEADDRALELVRSWPRDLISSIDFSRELYDDDRPDGRLKYRAEQAGIVRWKGNGTGRIRPLGKTGPQTAVWILRNANYWTQAPLDAVMDALKRSDFG